MRPLKDLLSAADRLIETEKVIKLASAPTAVAPASSSSEVSSVVEQIIGDPRLAGLDEFEKVAVVMNQIHADTQLSELDRVFRFTEAAYEEGHMNVQIEEALEKVAASRLKKRLVDFVAAGAAMASAKGDDVNAGKPITFNGVKAPREMPSGERPMASPSQPAGRVTGE